MLIFVLCRFHPYNRFSAVTELLTAAVFMGMLMGGVVAGNAGDVLGRRYCLLISLSVTVCFGALSSLAPSIGWLIATRVIAGIGESNVGRHDGRVEADVIGAIDACSTSVFFGPGIARCRVKMGVAL